MSKQEIEGKIADIEKALNNSQGLSAPQIAALKKGLMDYRRQLAAINELTPEQEAQRVQNIRNVDNAKVTLSGMIAMEGKQFRQPKVREEVATIEPIRTGRHRFVTITWDGNKPEQVTEKACRGGFKSAFDDLCGNDLVKEGRLDELDASTSMGRCATYLKAMNTLTGSLPTADYFGFRSDTKKAVYAAVIDYYQKNI